MLEIKICIKNIGVQHSLEKNETATMFNLKKPFLVTFGKENIIYLYCWFQPVDCLYSLNEQILASCRCILSALPFVPRVFL